MLVGAIASFGISVTPKSAAAAGTPAMTIGDVTTVEGDAGFRTLTFPVTLTAPANTVVTLRYQTVPLTATQGTDYKAKSGTLRLVPSALTGLTKVFATIAVKVNGDTQQEPAEAFGLRAISISGATLTDSGGVGTIIDDDSGASSAHIDIGDASVDDEGVGARYAYFTVSLSQPAVAVTTFVYTVQPGTAQPNTDLIVKTGTGKIPAGSSQALVKVTIVADSLLEGPETFTVRLTSVSDLSIAIGKSIGSGVITDSGLAAYAWGNNSSGQLGVGDYLPRTDPTLVAGGHLYRDVVTHRFHSVLIDANGWLYHTGLDLYGQYTRDYGPCPPDSRSSQDCYYTSPFRVGTSTGWEQVAAGGYYVLGKGIGDGAVVYWGALDNSAEDWLPAPQSGDMSGIGGTGFVRAGRAGVTMYTYDGSIVADGFDRNGIPEWPGTWIDGGIQSDGHGGFDAVWGVRSDGTIWTQVRLDFEWTQVALMQLGTDNDWASIEVDRMSGAYAIKTDGSLWYFARDPYTELPDGSAVQPQRIGTASDWKTVFGNQDTGAIHLLKTDGTLWDPTGTLIGWTSNWSDLSVAGSAGNGTSIIGLAR